MLYVTFADGFVTVSPQPWGHAAPDHEIGPVEDEFADTAVESVAKLLRSLGQRVLTPEIALGHWTADRCYQPHPDEIADQPVTV